MGTAGELKKLWAKEIRALMGDRKFRQIDTGVFSRANSSGSDGCRLRLRAAGRDETAVDLLTGAVSVSFSGPLEEATRRLGVDPDPNHPSWIVNFEDLLGPAGTLAERRLARGGLTIDRPADIPGATHQIDEFLTAYAENWWSGAHDPATVVDALLDNQIYRQFGAIEPLLMLALEHGYDSAASVLIDDYQRRVDETKECDTDYHRQHLRFLASLR